MHDRVAEVLAQRATLDRGAGIGIALSVAFHAALVGVAVYTALYAPAPEPAKMVSIQFAKMPASAPAPAAAPRERRTEAPRATPKIEEPKIVEPKPVVEKPPQKAPEKNTVPVSPFGKSTKKGSERPAETPPAPAPAPSTGNNQLPGAADIAVGGSGVTGLEGGDFPYSLYLQGMHRRIGDRWIRPTVPAGTAVVIFFRIHRDGTITDARVETTSGNGTFDRAALSAVRSASPLNTLPFAYSGNQLGVYLTFR